LVHTWVIPVWLLFVFIIFWTEWIVERSVLHNTEAWSLRLTDFVQVLSGVTWVLLLPLNWLREPTNYVEPANVVTEDELKTLVDAGQEEGIFEQGERQMIYSIFQLGDTLAREIMVPRIDVLALDVMTPLPQAVDAMLESGYSRAPIYEDTVDRTIGLLYTKDLLKVWREGNQVGSLRDLLRPAYFVPEAKKVDELLAEMQNRRVHMAIVVDEYGGVAGLVTLEDIVEEIVGEILDEYDQGEEALYEAKGDGEYVFLGRIDLDDFNEIMESHLDKEDADTLGGFIYSQLGRVPMVGEILQVENLELVVEQVSARRIHKVRAHWLPADKIDEVEENGRIDRS
jgi:CBS domain containing-hemolysin-like protein